MNVRKNDIGTIFELTVRDESGTVVNLATATVLQIRFRTPSGILLTKTAVLTGNGTDGKMQYTSLLNDISEEGVWYIQGWVEFSSTPKFATSSAQLEVLPASI